MMKNNDRNISRDAIVTRATIDLHGYNRSEAIKSLTMFLDQVRVTARNNKNKSSQPTTTRAADVWVMVITGTGAHSPEGPVLRTAIQQLLDKRQMVYTVNHGKGSFTVKANSGIVFYEPGMPTCSKVILVKDAPNKKIQLPNSSGMSTRKKSSNKNNDPPPSVACGMIDNNDQESKKQFQKTFLKQKNDEKMIHKAISVSLHEARQEKENEEKQMKRVLSLSAMEATEPVEDSELQEALERSRLEFEEQSSSAVGDEEIQDDDLLRALELSQKLASADDEYQLALELSKKASCQDDEDLLRIIELSRQEQQDEKKGEGCFQN